MPATTASHRKPKRGNHLPLTMMLKPEEFAQIEALASDEVRSRSSMARLLVAEALEARASHTAS
ncbi:hypothetical protein [Marinobacterium stanieri]|uniref:Uncharacterized protein n=1 Tax=Marinobacterium stanieri TaxID=49186 RepID=A0A1N6Q402_9GAMM|nr:hypothetical protein [Marinobacterium stanieri]SIQ11292.1 hypothetical protein SAMN05421647_102238 [Marinobacterium stanieri]